jgi:hypothetical protein
MQLFLLSLSALFFLSFIGCGNSDSDNSTTNETNNPTQTDDNVQTEEANETETTQLEEENQDIKEDEENQVESPNNSTNNENFQEQEVVEIQSDISVVGETIYFGSGDNSLVAEINNGDFGTVKYTLDSVSDLDMFLEFNSKIQKEITLFFMLDEVGTNRNFIFIVPNINIDYNGSLSGVNRISVFGTRSDGDTITAFKSLDGTEGVIETVDGMTRISMSKVLQLFPTETSSILSLVKADNQLNINFGISGIESFENSKYLYDSILQNYKGDILILLQNYLEEKKSFGFIGNILVQE